MTQKHPVLGFIMMGGSARLETYIHRNLPEAAEMATTRVPLTQVSYDGMVEMIDRIPDAARILSEAQPDVIAVTNFTASCIKGHEMVNLIQQATGIPAIVPSITYAKVLRQLKIDRVAVVSGFGTELRMLEQVFFLKQKIEAASFHMVDYIPSTDPLVVSYITDEQVLHAIAQVDSSSVDAIVVDIPIFLLTPEVRQALLRIVPIPVLTMAEIILLGCYQEVGLPCDSLYISRFFPEAGQ